MKINVLVQTARPSFLILAPICVLLGVATAMRTGASLDWAHLVLVVLAALLSHVAVNALNEYQDFRSGLDYTTIKTPFSGGTGALPANPEMAPSVNLLAMASLSALFLIGLYFVWLGNLTLIPIGLLGIAIILTYTNWINRHPLLCLIAPGIGFGFLMVVGTHLALAGENSSLPWLVSLVPFFLTNNLLLLNQYPDIGPDTRVGRNHLLIAHGTRVGTFTYGLLAILALAVIVGGVLAHQLPPLSLLALLPLILVIPALRGAWVHGEALGQHTKYLAMNVVVSLATPLILALSLFFD